MVSHSNTSVKLYSLEHIFQRECMILHNIHPAGFEHCIRNTFVENDIPVNIYTLSVLLSIRLILLLTSLLICFQYLTEKVTLGKQSSLLGGKTVGDVPFGIPVNIQITGESVCSPDCGCKFCVFSLSNS